MGQTVQYDGFTWTVTSNEYVWIFNRKGSFDKMVPLASAATIEDAMAVLRAQDLAKLEKERAASIAKRQSVHTPIARTMPAGTVRCDSCHRPTNPTMLMHASVGSVCPDCFVR